MLILDEPTNHLDVDAREALVQALNAYTGCVLLVSHDRHMLEATADRLVLVDEGTAKEFDGTIDDYIALILGNSAKEKAKKANKKDDRKAAAEAREKAQVLKKGAQAIERDLARLTEQRDALDAAMAGKAIPALAKLTMAQLMKRRASLDTEIEVAETKWMEANEALEALAA
jgi:ATP-binding cassette subfamily F protein 3